MTPALIINSYSNKNNQMYRLFLIPPKKTQFFFKNIFLTVSSKTKNSQYLCAVNTKLNIYEYVSGHYSHQPRQTFRQTLRAEHTYHGLRCAGLAVGRYVVRRNHCRLSRTDTAGHPRLPRLCLAAGTNFANSLKCLEIFT